MLPSKKHRAGSNPVSSNIRVPVGGLLLITWNSWNWENFVRECGTIYTPGHYRQFIGGMMKIKEVTERIIPLPEKIVIVSTPYHKDNKIKEIYLEDLGGPSEVSKLASEIWNRKEA